MITFFFRYILNFNTRYKYYLRDIEIIDDRYPYYLGAPIEFHLYKDKLKEESRQYWRIFT